MWTTRTNFAAVILFPLESKRGDWKMIVKEQSVQLYNLRLDPQESTDVVARHPDIAGSMKQAIDEFKANVTPGS